MRLKPGDYVSKVIAIDSSMSVSRLSDSMAEIRQQLRNACAPAVARAKRQTAADYGVEVGDVAMPSGNYYVVAVVTRKTEVVA